MSPLDHSSKQSTSHQPSVDDLLREITTQRSSIRTRVAFCGSRGLPANYGGFETAVDEISARFVAEGYTCDVFCRRSSGSDSPPTHDGRNLVYVGGSKRRSLDTFVSSFQTGWHLWRHRKSYSRVFWFNNANLPGVLMTAIARIPMSVNTDGLEWRRAKWSWPFKAYYYVSSWLICRVCKSLVSDSHGIQNYYKRLFSAKTSFIPYGAPVLPDVSEKQQKETLQQLNIERDRYFLQITRIEPDNLPLRIAQAFRSSGVGRQGFKLVIVGYRDATEYAQRLIAYDGYYGIQVRNAVYDQEVLYTLRKHCFCYVHGNSVGGTNPALLEAMATSPRVMAIDSEFSHEVLGEAGLYFDSEDIEPAFRTVLEFDEQSAMMQRRIARFYQWDAVAESYMRLADGRPADYQPRPEIVEVRRRLPLSMAPQ